MTGDFVSDGAGVAVGLGAAVAESKAAALARFASESANKSASCIMKSEANTCPLSHCTFPITVQRLNLSR